jgi:hypothetical protein
MATVDFTGGASVGTGIPADGLSKIGLLRSRVDTSLTGITNTNADVYQALDIPAGFYVLAAWFVCVSAESTNTTATFQLGITGDDTDEFVKATAPDTTGEIFPMDGDAKALNGTYFATADTLDLLVATAAFTDAIVDVYALVLDMNP